MTPRRSYPQALTKCRVFRALPLHDLRDTDGMNDPPGILGAGTALVFRSANPSSAQSREMSHLRIKEGYVLVHQAPPTDLATECRF